MLVKRHEPIVYKIYRVLKNHVGNENAISGADLAEMFEISKRQLRECIHVIRNSSELTRVIGSSNKGYFMCREEEFRKANNRLYSQAFSLLNIAREQDKKAGLNGQGKIKIGKYYKDFVESFAE